MVLSTVRKGFEKEVIDNVYGFRAARDYLFSTSLNTRVYGMVQMKKGKMQPFRHVLSPTVSYGYRPTSVILSTTVMSITWLIPPET
jgi:hypothetical protein